MTKAEVIKQIQAVGRTCRGPIKPEARAAVALLLAEGKRQEALAVDHGARTPCGYDFNKTILAGPLDGDIHKYECPRCGLTGIYRAPLFETEE